MDGKGGLEMVLYVDTAFAVNALADALALYAAAALSGLRLSRRRLGVVSALGGLYGVACLLPGWAFLGSFPCRAAAGAALAGLAFGRRPGLCRLFVLFFLLSCTLGGAFLCLDSLWAGEGAWTVFFGVALLFYALLGRIFRGSLRHAAAGQLCPGRVLVGGTWVPLTVLLDTGHTIADPACGCAVLTVREQALRGHWPAASADILAQLHTRGPLWCMQRLAAVQPGLFRLLPYRSVGVEDGLLLCFTAPRAEVAGRRLEPVTVALWPGGLGEEEGFNALWGGMKEEKRDAA